tara:strand:- start:304 stop:735 length:432 start_codon:yes stop_codon:yes gene_type:complete
MDKKIPKEKLFGKLAKEITPKALNTYRQDMQNFKNFHSGEPYKATAVPVKKTKNYFSDDWHIIENAMTAPERREFYRDKPQKEKPKDLYKDLPKFDYEGLTKDIREISKKFLKYEEPLVRPDFKPKKDSDLQNGLGSLIRVKD